MSERKGKERKSAKLTLNRIVGEAIALLEAEDAGALSARKLAARLGCEAMSLYHYVRSMDDLLDAIVDHILGSLLPIEETGDLQADMRASALAYLNLARRFPNSFVFVATRRWRTPRAIAFAGAFITRFQSLGLDQIEALRRSRILGAYVNGAGLALSAWSKQPGAGVEAVEADLQSGFDHLSSTLLTS